MIDVISVSDVAFGPVLPFIPASRYAGIIHHVIQLHSIMRHTLYVHWLYAPTFSYRCIGV